MNQSKNSVIFSFANMKGGVGKSTLTTVVSNYIFKETDFNVCICDCDDKQLTIQHWRDKDIENGFREEDNYDIHPIKSKQFPTQVPLLNGNYHFISVDVPGSIMQEGVMSCYAMLDVIFIPFNFNETDFDSTLKFVNEYQAVDKLRQELGFPPTEKYLLFSKIDKRMGYVKQLDAVREQSPLPVLRNLFPYSPAAFGRDSTTARVYKKGDQDTEALCQEVLEILVKQHNNKNS